jgi:hypothetical protein
VRGVEDRAHREVDRGREEGKAMSAQLKEAGRHVEQLQRRLESVQTLRTETGISQRRPVRKHRAEQERPKAVTLLFTSLRSRIRP